MWLCYWGRIFQVCRLLATGAATTGATAGLFEAAFWAQGFFS
jgi:hypothetical protein